MSKQLRVLLVEDSEDDGFFTVQELKRGGFDPHFRRVDSLDALESALDSESWDVIICDHSLPGFDSFQALEATKRRSCDIPFIIVSGVIGEEMAVKAMKAGANDYVMKSALGRLVPSIERELQDAVRRRAGRQVEKALSRSQYDLNDFFDNAPLSLHWAAPDGEILRVNAAAAELLGYSPAELTGFQLREFFVDQTEAENILRRLRSHETLQDYPAQLLCKKGAIKQVRINANGLWDDCNFIRSRWFMLDVTQRNQYEQAIAFLGAIVNSSEDAIIGTDLQGNIVSWNNGASRMYGYTAEGAIGRPIAMLTPPSRPEGTLESPSQILEMQTVDCYETRHVRKDGETIPVSVTRSPIKDSQGKVIGISAIERDITLRKQEEHEKIFLIQELSRALADAGQTQEAAAGATFPNAK